jgi:TolB-like protein
VSVAARLEALCEPGGVCISRSANEQVRNKLSLAFADLGAQTVKNIAQSVGVFGLAARDIATLPDEALPEPEPPELRTPLAPEQRSPTRAMVAGGVVLAAIFALGGWWMLHERTAVPVVAATTPMVPRPAAYSPEDRRRSTIVLPFENSSGDPSQDSVAAGFTRDVTNRISVNRDSPLVPAATAAAYRGKTVDLQTIGRDHNVHFALIGNARRENGRLFVSVALYETAADKMVWSQQFDRPDSSDEWNRIVLEIGDGVYQAAVDSEVTRARREHPKDLDKRDLLLTALSTSLSATSKQNYLARIALIDQALAIDPDNMQALLEKSRVYAFLVVNGFSSDPSGDLSAALQAADRTLQLAPSNVGALGRKARVLYWQGDLEGSATLFRKVIALNPLNVGWWYRELGQVQMAQGPYKEALENFLTAKRLVPEMELFNGPDGASIEESVASGFLANDRFPEAIATAQLAIAQWGSKDIGRSGELPWLTLIAAESQDGQDAQARADLQKFLATPRMLRTIADIQRSGIMHFATIKQLLDGLRRAGDGCGVAASAVCQDWVGGAQSPRPSLCATSLLCAVALLHHAIRWSARRLSGGAWVRHRRLRQVRNKAQREVEQGRSRTSPRVTRKPPQSSLTSGELEAASLRSLSSGWRHAKSRGSFNCSQSSLVGDPLPKYVPSRAARAASVTVPLTGWRPRADTARTQVKL